jgi:hypothetical protein
MAARQSNISTGFRVVGAAPLGVTKKVAADIVRAFREQLSQTGREVNVKAMRFIPSSRATTERGSFQVVANNFIEIVPGNNASPRYETLDSVVTVGRQGGVQKLEGLTIPALQRAVS